MKCRFLYLVGQLGAGGSERQLYWLLRAMDRERYRPQLFVWNFCAEDTYVAPIRELGVPIRFFAGTLTPAKKLFAFRHVALELRPEVIHSYSFYTNFAASTAAMGTRTIAVGAVRSNFEYDRKSCGCTLGALNARWPGGQIYNSFAAAEEARKSRGFFFPRQVMVVRNGLDLKQFRTVPLSINGRARIVSLGSLLHVKRWDRLLNAAMQLRKGGLDFSIEIAGAGPFRESLDEHVRKLGLMDRVKFTGHVDDVASLLADSTFVAHTSDVEGCPNVVMEAMACGRAVVATDAGDIPSLVEDGKTGFVVPRGDDAKLVERLASLIADRDLCRKMGRASRAKAEREFGLNRLVKETLAAYQAAGWRDRL